jgi:hypothetical protein
MTGTDLRAALVRLGVSQVAFARLAGVSTRAVTLWLSEERPIPGPVEAYVRVLSLTPESVRAAEIQRFDESEQSMREGLYTVEYVSTDTGKPLAGYGALIFDNGRVYGGDPVGGLYNGEYIYNPANGTANVNVKLTFPPGGVAVFGVSLPYEWSVEAETTFDPNASHGAATLKTVQNQTVQVRFHYIRPLLAAA